MVWLGCKKPDNAGLSNGIPECNPGYLRDGNQCRLDTSIAFMDDWGRLWRKEYQDSLWYSFTECPYADSTYICIMSFDATKLPYQRGLALKIAPYSEGLDGGTGLPLNQQNYWPDAIRGDSVIWMMPYVWGEYEITFYGRFNPAQDTLRGKLRYTPSIRNPPVLPECGPIIFTKVKKVQ